MDVYENLRSNGLELPPPPAAGGLYAKAKRTGNYLYISGQGPSLGGGPVTAGKLGAEISLEQGQAAARACALNILSCLEEHLKDLNRVKNVVKLLGFVASSDDFYQQPQVINAASGVFLQAFGEIGAHARSAIGVNTLPGNIPVEIEAIFEI